MRKTLILAVIFTFLASCSVKEVTPTLHDKAKEESNIIYKQQESEPIKLMGQTITESSLYSLEKMVEGEEQSKVIEFVYEASKVFTGDMIRTYGGSTNYSNLFSLYNRALLNLVGKLDHRHPEVEHLNKIVDEYFTTMFAGCEKKCLYYSFFAGDYNTAHVILNRISLLGTTQKVEERYRLLDFAYGIQNRVIDIEFAYQYARFAEQYAQILKANGDEEGLNVHRRLYLQVLRRMNEHTTDERVIRFIDNALDQKEGAASVLVTDGKPFVLEMAQKIIRENEGRRGAFLEKIFAIPEEIRNQNPSLAKLFAHNLGYTAILNQLFKQEIDTSKAYQLWGLAGGEVGKIIDVAKSYLDIEYEQMTEAVNGSMGEFFKLKKDQITPKNFYSEFRSYSGGKPLSLLRQFLERKDVLVNFLRRVEPEFTTSDRYGDVVNHFESYKFNASIDIQLPQALIAIYYSIKTMSYASTFDYSDAKTYILGSPYKSLRQLFEGTGIDITYTMFYGFADKGSLNKHDVLHGFERIIERNLLKGLTAAFPEYDQRDFVDTLIRTLAGPVRERFERGYSEVHNVVESAEFKKGQKFCASSDPQHFGVVIEQSLGNLMSQVYFSTSSDLYTKSAAFYASLNELVTGAGISDFLELDQNNRISEHRGVTGALYALADLYSKHAGVVRDVKELQGLVEYQQSKKKIVDIVKQYRGKVVDCNYRFYQREFDLQFQVLEKLQDRFNKLHQLFLTYIQAGDQESRESRHSKLLSEIKDPIWSALEYPGLEVVDGITSDGIIVSNVGILAVIKGFLAELAPELKVVVPPNLRNSALYLNNNQSSTIRFDEDRTRFVRNALETIASKFLNWGANNQFALLNYALGTEIYLNLSLVDIKERSSDSYRDSISNVMKVFDYYKNLLGIDEKRKESLGLLNLRQWFPESAITEYFLDPETLEAKNFYDLFVSKAIVQLAPYYTMGQYVYASYFSRSSVFVSGEKLYDEIQPYIYNQIKNRMNYIDLLLSAIEQKEKQDYDSHHDSIDIVYQLNSDFTAGEKAITVEMDHDTMKAKYLGDDIRRSYVNGLSEFHEATNNVFVERGK